MNKNRNTLTDSLYIAWAIATKDIADALQNKGTLVNILVVLGMVVFFHWTLTLRPFDKQIDTVVFNQGDTDLERLTAELADGSSFSFREANSLEEMKERMVFQDLGLVIPAGFDQELASGQVPTLTGYLFWAHRASTTELESEYSEKLSTLLGQPVQVSIGENWIVPQLDNLGDAAYAAYYLFFAQLWIAISVVPFLVIEEKRSKTLEALLVSPASASQVILGKALAGLFYVVLAGGLSLILNGPYVYRWGLVIPAFVCSSLFAVAVALVMGAFIRSPQHTALWTIPVVLFLLLPALFARERNLVQGIREIITWFPSTALVSLSGYAVSKGATVSLFLINLAIGLGSAVLLYGLVIWQVRRSDR